MENKFFPVLVFSLLLSQTIHAQSAASRAYPLHVESRWIVDANGERVKFACVNWTGSTEVVVAEGLDKEPLNATAQRIVDMGFNCVRLTYPTYLLTNASYANLTVTQSMQKFALNMTISGITANNPDLLDLPLLSAFQEVVHGLGNYGVMVILDNHLTEPGWCCADDDGNGFFGDQDFDPNTWIQGLNLMAATFNNVSNVVGMSLRNELRGPRQNVDDWFRYMQQGAEAVHQAKPDVLVILSGLGYDTDLSFLKNQPVNLTFTNKIVYEVHRYSFSLGNNWESTNANEICKNVLDSIMNQAGFLLERGSPLFVSEWGVNIKTHTEDKFWGCLASFLAENDLDWAFWTLQGSYYYRQGVAGMEEHFGLLSKDWAHPRNETYLTRLSALQTPFRGPGFSKSLEHKILFHPLTGLCAISNGSQSEPLVLGPCKEAAAWTYTSEKALTLLNTSVSLQAVGSGQPAGLGTGASPNSTWTTISDSKLHLSVESQGTQLCLDVNGDTIVMNPCKCLAGDSQCDPTSQWFKMVDSTRI